MPEKRTASGRAKKTIRVVDTYQEMRKYLAGFRDGKINLLVVVGSWGVGKSRLAREFLGDDAGWIEGSSTAFGIYSTLHRHRNRPIVIDDVDGLYSDPKCVGLLKSICRTEDVKPVAWNARSSFLRSEGLPSSFETSSRVLIIANQWRTLNRNVAALEDRGQVLSFEPSPAEVHEQASAWVLDREIFEWFGGQLERMEAHSFRNYVRAAELKACGIPWRQIPGKPGKDMREALALDLINDPAYGGSMDRARAFERRGGGSRSTFFNYKRKFEEGQAPAPVPSKPPATVAVAPKKRGRPPK